MFQCRVCRHVASEPFKFCPECGAPAAVADAREERKTVTVLFCDVVGSTELGERLEPESLRRVLARYFSTVRAVIERHGGSVEKFIGDAAMAVFGVPVLHEDDALRAVRAAAGLREALGPLNEELTRDFGIVLSMRIGINTGEVVTGTDERLATGDAVNVAARLEQRAGAGEILLGRDDARASCATPSTSSRCLRSSSRASAIRFARGVSVEVNDERARRLSSARDGRSRGRDPQSPGAFAASVDRLVLPARHGRR